jgi:hypothetical protein
MIEKEPDRGAVLFWFVDSLAVADRRLLRSTLDAAVGAPSSTPTADDHEAAGARR